MPYAWMFDSSPLWVDLAGLALGVVVAVVFAQAGRPKPPEGDTRRDPRFERPPNEGDLL
jgi:hypothetical protein